MKKDQWRKLLDEGKTLVREESDSPIHATAKKTAISRIYKLIGNII